jgi:hypothetical protein
VPVRNLNTTPCTLFFVNNYISTIQRSSYNTLKSVNPLPILESHILILLYADEQDYCSSKYELFKVLQLVAQVLFFSIRSSFSIVVLPGRIILMNYYNSRQQMHAILLKLQ